MLNRKYSLQVPKVRRLARESALFKLYKLLSLYVLWHIGCYIMRLLQIKSIVALDLMMYIMYIIGRVLV